MVLEKTPESPLDRKEIKPANPKGNQPFIFIGRTDAKRKLIGKDPDTWGRWKAGGEGKNIGRDSQMASPTQ